MIADLLWVLAVYAGVAATSTVIVAVMRSSL